MDFLVNIRKYLKDKYFNKFNLYLVEFKDYLCGATKEQLLYFFEKDEHGFLAEIERLEPHSGGRGTVVREMSDDFAVKHPQYAVYASKKQLQRKFESEAPNDNLTFKQRRELIYKWLKAQGIEYLVYFTYLSNLKSILEKGLITRANIERSNADFAYTNPHRYDGVKNSISLSVSFPNYRMFCNKKSTLTDRKNNLWCVLLLKTEILRDIDCAFLQPMRQKRKTAISTSMKECRWKALRNYSVITANAQS